MPFVGERPSGDDMIQKILCPTDGSESAEKAVSLAIDLAEKYGAELVMLHVKLADAVVDDLEHFAQMEGLAHSVQPEVDRLRSVQSQSLAAGGPALSEPISVEVLETVAEHTLQSAERFAKSKGVSKVTTRVDQGHTGKRILACAEEEGVDMIVMGSRGLGKLQELLLGSTSQYVSQRAPCTCVTVS